MDKPLVSILIPVTGNSTYLELALTSALLQTYTNIEIIIRDSLPTNNLQILLEKEFLPYSPTIIYIKDNRYMSRLETLQELLNLSSGTYVNFLMEKDLFYPSKIEKMMNYFSKDTTNSVKLVTSCTASIDMHGNLIDYDDNIEKNNSDMEWDSTVSSNLILKHTNYIGGISTPLFRKQDLLQPFGFFAGHQFIREIEMATWLNLLSQGSLVCISENLIFERKNIDKQNNKIDVDLITDWINIIKLAEQNSYLVSKTTKVQIIKKIWQWINYLLINKQNILKTIEREKISNYNDYLYELQINI